MCRPPSSSRVRRRACGLPYPASAWRSRPSVALHVCFLTGAPRRRRPGRCSPFHAPIPPASSGVRRGGGGGDSPAHRLGADGRCASPVMLPRSPPGRFGRATADYVDCPQVTLGSRHRPGTAPGPAGDHSSPLRASAGDPTPIKQVKARTWAKLTTGFSLSKPVPGFKSGYRFSGCRLTP